MGPGPGIAVVLSGLSIFLAIWAFKAPRKDFNLKREETYIDENERSARNYIAPLLNNFLEQSPVNTNLGVEQEDRIRQLILKSGNPWNLRPYEFRGTQIVFAILGAVLGLLISLPNIIPAPAFVFVLLFGLLGYFIPLSVYNTARDARSKEIQKQLPDALDLLVVIMKSGQNFEPALAAISEKMPDGLLKNEFARVSSEINAGRSLPDALTSFSNRVSNEEAENFAKAVAQAQRLGSDVSEALTAQARASREAYEALVQKKTAKLSSTMFLMLTPTLIPAMVLIFVAPSMTGISGSL